MTLLHLAAVVERRLLVNYRIDPDVAARLLPSPLRLQLVRGAAVGGICLIRLGEVRPWPAPAALGVRSENAAHRIAVTWDTDEGPRNGVYIPRRHSSSRLTVAAGGRLFPGEHAAAKFTVTEDGDELSVGYTAADGSTEVRVAGRVTTGWPGSELFGSLEDASAFFRGGDTGYSETRAGRALDGMQMVTDAWRIEAVELGEVRSSFYDDLDRFPAGTAVLDSALVMRGVPVTWNALRQMPIGAV
jgi:hypothetical protein